MTLVVVLSMVAGGVSAGTARQATAPAKTVGVSAQETSPTSVGSTSASTAEGGGAGFTLLTVTTQKGASNNVRLLTANWSLVDNSTTDRLIVEFEDSANTSVPTTDTNPETIVNPGSSGGATIRFQVNDKNKVAWVRVTQVLDDGSVYECVGAYDDKGMVLGDFSCGASAPGESKNLTTSPGVTGFTEGGGPVVVDGAIQVNGSTYDSFQRARVSIDDGFDPAADALSYDASVVPTDDAGNPIVTAVYNRSTGVLAFNGTAGTTVYQDLLRTVTYNNTKVPPTTADRNLTFTLVAAEEAVRDVYYNPATDHYYEYVPARGITWTAANSSAAGTTYAGMGGYLATITAEQENDFLLDRFQAAGWLGATDSASEGTWRWVTGPEGAEDGGAGRYFFDQTAAHVAFTDPYPAPPVGVPGGGTAVGSNYSNWAPHHEPDNKFPFFGGQDYAYFCYGPGSCPTGMWKDAAANSPSFTPTGYFVEYGGPTVEPSPQTVNLSDSKTVTIATTSGDTTPPTASAAANTTAVSPGDPIELDASGSDGTGSAIVRYEWDVTGNGRTDLQGVTNTTSFQNASDYTVTLTVTDAGGNTDTDTVTITVADTNPPTAVVSVNGSTTVDRGEAVQFTGTNSTDDVAVRSFEWDFGDGSANSSEVSPTHGYDETGTYTVTLVVNDTSNNTASDTLSIDVTSSPRPVIYEFNATNPSGTTVNVSLRTDQRLDHLAVDVYDTSQLSPRANDSSALVYTIDETDFGPPTESGGNFTYTNTTPGLDPGTYTARLQRAENATSGDSGTGQEATVTVTSAGLTADAGANVTLYQGSWAELNASASTSTEGIASYAWDFDGDGTTDLTTTSPTTKHTFWAVGANQVTLTVTDTSGNTDTDEVTVTVEAANAKYHGGPGNLGHYPNVTGPTSKPQAGWNISEGTQQVMQSTIVGDTLYTAFHDGGTLYALDPTTGAEKWNATPGGQWGSTWTTPAYANGVLYLGSNDYKLHAINASDGTELWNYSTQTNVRSAPAVVDGVVYFGSNDGNMTAVNATTGEELWVHTVYPTLRMETNPAVVDGVVYFGGDHRNVTAVHAANGTKIWNFSTRDEIQSDPTVVDDTVYIGSDSTAGKTSGNGVVYSLNATDGTERWHYNMTGDVDAGQAYADGVLYAVSRGGDLVALNATDGTKIWNVTGDEFWGAPVVAGGVVYVSDYGNGSVHALDVQDGTPLWNYTSPEGALYPTPLVWNNFVYYGSASHLWAIEQPGPAISGVRVTNPSGQDVQVSLDSDVQLADISVSLTGPSSTTFTEADFTESGSGPYTYTLDSPYDAGADGSYTVSVDTAKNAEGKDGATGQTDSVVVDTKSPALSSFDVSNTYARDVNVTFVSDESLDSVTVAISGAESGTLTAADFTETGSGPYTYDATYEARVDGSFTATLVAANDSSGNDGAAGQSDSVIVDRFPISESFDGTKPAEWTVRSDASWRTGAGGQQTLRLTDVATDQNGIAFYDVGFNASAGFTAAFSYYADEGTGADGLSFFLVDGDAVDAATIETGALGGSLGYAQGSGDGAVDTPGERGVPHAYLGIGFDEYGGFAAATECREGGETASDADPADEEPQSVTLRGAGDGGTCGSGYPHLTTADVTGQGGIDGGWRRVRVTVEANNTTGTPAVDASDVLVEMSWDDGQTWTTVIDHTYQNQPPSRFKLGFAGSTGGSTNVHAIENLSVTLPGPELSGFTASSPGAQNVSVAFQSDKPIGTIQVSISGPESGTLTMADFTETGSGPYSYRATYEGSSDGTYTATVDQVLDANGNDGTSGQSDTVTVDATPPAAPSTPDLTAASDTGSSNTDDVTGDATPTLSGTAEPGATITILSDQDGTLGTATADGNGDWTFTPDSALSEGTHNLTATATDAAGNTGPASGSLHVTVDSVAPAAPSAADLAPGSDTGSSSTDDVTGDATPTLSGTAEPGATITITSDRDGVLGTATVDGNGDWTFTPDSALSEGTHNLTVTATDDAGNVGPASNSLRVTVDTSSPSPDAGSNRTVDEDAPTSFNGSASTDAGGIASFEWDFGDGSATAIGATPTHTYSQPGTYTVTLTVTDTAGNVAVDTQTVTVADVSSPAADAGSNLTVDEDASVQFNGSRSTDNVGITSYEWDFGDGNSTTAGPTPNHTYSQPGTYTVTVTVVDAAGNVGTDTLTVVVSDTTAPVATATGNTSVAEDTAVTFDGSNSTDNVGVANYTWTFGDGASASGPTPSHTYSEPGTYTVSLIVSDSDGRIDTDTLTVTVADTTVPIADVDASRTVDEDTVVTFDGSNSTDNVGVTNYTWTFGDGTTADGAFPSHRYTAPGTYTAQLTVEDAAGHTATDTMTVTVRDVTPPTANASTNFSAVEDAALGFSARNSTDNVGIVSYEWDFGDGTTATSVTATHTYANSGTFTVTLTVSDAAGNVATESFKLRVSEASVLVASAGSGKTVAEDTAVTFSASQTRSNEGIDSYEWTFGDGSNATGVSSTHSYSQPGSYRVTLSVTDAEGNVDEDSVTVTVLDTTAPTAAAGGNRTLEEDTPFRFDGTNSTDNVGVVHYAWDFGDGSTATGITPRHAYDEPGRYNLTLTVVDGAGNVDTDSAVVTVEDVTPPTADAGSDLRSVDEDASIAFSAANSTDNVQIANFTWTFGDATTTGGSGSPNLGGVASDLFYRLSSQPTLFAPTVRYGDRVNHTYTQSGTYTVSLNVTDTSGNLATETVTVLVNETSVLIVDAGSSTTAAEDTPVGFSASQSRSNEGVASYHWEFGDGTSESGLSPAHTYTQPGTYTVTLTITDAEGNTASDTITVIVEDVTPPNADAGGDRTVAEDTPVSVTASGSTDNVGVAHYDWEFGDGTVATGTSQTHTYSEPGTYTVTLTTTDAAGNAATDSLTVTVTDTTAPTATAGPDRTVDQDTALSFDGTASSDNVGITNYRWDFGDGTTSVSPTPTHVYTAPGTYTVTLTTTDAAGNVATDTATVVVERDGGPSDDDPSDLVGEVPVESPSGTANETGSDASNETGTGTPDESPADSRDESPSDTGNESPSDASNETTDGGRPTIGVVPRALNFGNVSVGSTKTLTVVVENLVTSTQDLEVATTHITGQDPEEFAVVGGGAPFTLAPGEQRRVTVAFSPGSPGEKQAQLQIVSDAGVSQIDVWLSNTRSYILVQEVGADVDRETADEVVRIDAVRIDRGSHLVVNVSRPDLRRLPASVDTLGMTVERTGNFTMNVTHSADPVYEGDATFDRGGLSTIQYVHLDYSIPASEFVDTSFVLRLNESQLPDSTDPEAVAFYRYADGSWNEQPTTLAEKRGDTLVYHVDSKGFSQFVVVGDATEPTAERPPGLSLLLVLAVSAGLLLLFVLLTWRRDEEEEADAQDETHSQADAERAGARDDR